MPSPIHLSIVVPAYNESKRILPTLEKIAAYLARQPYSYEVIVVDDASTDLTPSVVMAFGARHPWFHLIINERNMGKGASVRRGMLEAKGAFRLFTDADLSTPIEELDNFFRYAPPFDVVIGSRRVRGSNVAKRQPIMREASGRLFSILVRLLTMRGFVDTQCGFKMFSALAADDVFRRQTIDRFGFDVEILFIAKKLGYRVRETAVTWFDSPDTRVRLFHDAPKMFLDLLAIRVNDAQGKYEG